MGLVRSHCGFRSKHRVSSDQCWYRILRTWLDGNPRNLHQFEEYSQVVSVRRWCHSNPIGTHYRKYSYPFYPYVGEHHRRMDSGSGWGWGYC